MAKNPNPARIDDSMWWLAEQIVSLEPKDFVLAGIYANKSGYHNTRDANAKSWPGNYSITHADDKAGPGDKAAAIDITSRSAQGSNFKIIAKYTKRVIDAGKAKDPRVEGWREVFGNADLDRQVEGWDFRRGVASTSDLSHLWHFHLSEVRRYLGSKTNKEAMLSVLKGEKLADYIARGGKFVKTATPAPKPAAKPAAKPTTHKVQRGETLGGIAQRYGTTVAKLSSLNGIKNPNVIFPGRVLKLPTTAKPSTHKVARGDSLSGIAERYGTTVAKLRTLNKISDPNVIFPGQVLKLR